MQAVCRLASSTLITAALLSAVAAQAQTTFNFETVAPNAFTASTVPVGYGGATWTDWVLRRSSDFSGFVPFVVNGTTMALSTGAAPRIDFAVPTVYYGAFIGNPAQGGLSTGFVTVDFYRGGVLVASNPGVDLNASFVASSYLLPVDRVVFGHTGGRTITLDDVSLLTPVPEPRAWALFAAGLAVLAGLKARRR